MTLPLVSIIIPCYNGGGHIAESIRSALDQAYAPVEVIVVDDGSTDDSLAVIKSFGDSIRLLTGPRQGAPAARNRALAVASGEYVQFLDADDVLLPDKIEKQVKVFLVNRVDVVLGDAQVICDSNVERIAGYWRPRMNPDPVLVALGPWPGGESPLFTRKCLLDIGGWDASLPCSQDRDLILRLACAGMKFDYAPGSATATRRISGSLSSNTILVVEQYPGILARARKTLEVQGQMTATRRLAFAEFLATAARSLLLNGRRDKAREYLRLAADYDGSQGLGAVCSPIMLLACRLFGPLNVLTARLQLSRTRKWIGRTSV